MLSRIIHALLLALPLVSLLPVSSIFAKETDSEIPLPSISASLQPDLFTGTLTGSIPIEVPQGRNGMQPNLALNYASSNGNSWTGVGWDLELGAIERQTKWSVLYSPSTTQENAGRVYTLRMNGISADLVPTGGGEYRAKIEGHFLRIKNLSEGAGGWEVTDKKGVKYRFGTTTSTRMADPALGTKIFKWCLEKITDRDGNYLTATYVGDNNQLYLDQISYGGNDGTGGGAVLSHTKTVKFWRDAGSRPDKLDEYTRGYRVKTQFRLNTVSINADGSLVRVYKLGYTQNTNTTDSRLATVQQFGKDAAVNASGTITNEPLATKYPVLSMQWQENATQLPTPNYNAPAIMGLNDPPFLGDFNGDGKTDFTWAPSNGDGRMLIAYGAASGFTLPSYDPPALAYLYDGVHVNGFSVYGSKKFGDFDGDGKTDYMWIPSNGDGRMVIAYGAAWGFYAPFNSYIDPALNNLFDGSHYNQNFGTYEHLGDFNGDGRTDYMWVPGNGDGRWMVAYNLYCSACSIYISYDFPAPYLGNLFDGTYYNRSFPGVFNTTHSHFGDFNGDGRTDYMWVPGNGDGRWLIAYGTTSGVGYGYTTYSFPAIHNLFDGQYLNRNISEFEQVGDFNGDGKTDYMWVPNNGDGRWLIAYGADSGFTWAGYNQPALANLFDGVYSNKPALISNQQVGDFNGDGKSDYMWIPSNGDGRWLIAYGTELGFTVPSYDRPALANQFDGSTANNAAYAPLFQKFGDFNGDAKMDYLWRPSNGDGRWLIAYGASLVPDLLASLSTGLGGATTITYDTAASGPYNHRVTQITTCDKWNGTACTGTSSSTQYSYSGAYYHIAERDYRGVNKTTVTGPVGPNGEQTKTETWFHQGNDVAVDVNNPNVADGYTAGLPYRVRISNSNVPVVETTTSYLPDPGNAAPWFTPPAIVTTTFYDKNGVLAKQTQSQAVTYDAYGNVTLSYDRGDFTNNNTNATDDTTTAVSFGIYDTTNWLVAFPIAQATYAGQGIGGSKLTETKYSYDGAGSCTTPVGNQTPTKGHVTKVEQYRDQGGLTPISGMEYDSYGNLTCTRDPRGKKTNLVYDSATSTFPLTSTNALGHVTTTVYYGVNSEPIPTSTGFYGEVKSVTDPNSKTTNFTYDALGRKLTTTTPDLLATTMAYNYGGTFVVGTQHVQRTISAGGLSASLVSKAFFDGLGRTTKEQQPSAADGGGALKVIVTDTEYDVRGLIRRTSLPYFTGDTVYWRTLDYDALDRVIKTTNPDNTISQVCYNAWTTTTIDPGLHKKVEMKDASGRLITVQEYTGTQANCATTTGTLYATTNYTYSPVGNLLSVTDTKGNVSSMSYDTLSRKLTMHDPDMGNWSYVYDENGNLTKQTDAKGQVLWFQYDELNRRRQKDYTTQKALGSGDVVYNYDDTVAANNGKGRLKQVTDAAQSVSFQYDSRGRIKQSAKTLDGTTYTTTSVYDGLGRLTSVNYPANPNTTPPTPVTTLTYTYDGPQLKQVTEGATTYVTYSNFNAIGQPGTTAYGNQVVTTRTYQPTTFRLQSLQTVNSPDITAPTVPSALSTTVMSSTQINLSWIASTDNAAVTGYRVERCQGVECATFTEIGTPTGITYSSTGLLPNTSYSYRVRATDAAGNLSAYSATATTATMVDTTAPSAPTTLTVTFGSVTQINLSWTASTDNVVVTGYRVERCQGVACTTFTQVSIPTGTTFDNTGLLPNTYYSYRVRATDAAGNLSDYSATATTATMVDTTAPSIPGLLIGTIGSATQILLSWTVSTDDVAVTGYRVERCQGVGCATFTEIGTPTGTTYSSTGLLPNTSYSYRARATDAAGNLSGYTATATVMLDSTTPSAPADLTGTVASATQINLSWTASTDNVAVMGYRVERCQGVGCVTYTEIGTPTGITYSSTGLLPNTSYSHRVRATDTTGNLSGYSTTTTATTLVDTTAPSTPSTLRATGASATQVNLNWTASTDNVGVARYEVYRSVNNGTYSKLSPDPTGTTFTDSGLTANTVYLYRVVARDAANNASANSNTDVAITIALTNDLFIAGTTSIKGIDITEVRAAVNVVRVAAGLATATWTDPTIIAGTTLVKAVHMQELRTALNEARTALGVSAMTFTDPTLTAGSTVIKKVHLDELR